jgi:protein ImuB
LSGADRIRTVETSLVGATSAPLKERRLNIALYATVNRRTRILAASAEAIACGVRPGLPLIEAQATAPEVHFERHDPRSDRAALERLALWCQRFSPLVALEETETPDCLLLDVTGCGPVFGGEEKLANRVLRALARHRLKTRVAVADTVGAAWAVAHFDVADAHIVPPKQHARLLGPLPIEALRLPDEVVTTLHAFDLRRVEQLLTLPRADLPARFGPLLVRRFDQAFGDVREVLKFEHAEEPAHATWNSDDPLVHRHGVETVLSHLLDDILAKLRPRQQGVQHLLCIFANDADVVTMPVRLLKPSDHAEYLLDLIRLHLERTRLPAEVSAVAVRAIAALPIEIRQDEIFASDDGGERDREFRVLLERLTSRLGEQAVLQPQLFPDAQPEYAWRRGKCGAESGKKNASSLPDSTPHAPLILRRPTAVAVTSVVPGGPPLRLWWQDRDHVVRRSWGPERIETGWWRGRDVRRDYYLVEIDSGERFWLFRTLLAERWFLHGSFV